MHATSRIGAALFLALVLLGAGVTDLFAQKAGQIGVITHRNTPVKAGSGIPDAQIMKAGVGDLVEFFGYSGEFAEVRFPGGVEAFVLEKRNGRTFVELAENGKARVLVDRLTLRPHANLDWPSMGTLKANQSLVVLDRANNDWLRVLAPSDVHVYVHKNYVKLHADQNAAAAEFVALEARRRRTLLDGGKISAKSRASLEQEDALQKRYADAEARMNEKLRNPQDVEWIAGMKKEFEEIRSAATADSKLARAAGEKIAYLQGKEDMARRFADAEARIKKLEAERKARETTYQRDLGDYRAKKEAEKKAAAKEKSRFLRLGIGTLHKIYLGVGRTPTWVLSKGSESRYHVTSDRYDLSEFHEKTIGITSWKLQAPAPGSKLERVEIIRLEVLD